MRLPRHLSTPLVLAASSAMFSAGLAAVLMRRPPTPHGDTSPRHEVVLRTETARDACETFLDAWRKRDHVTALRLSSGPLEAQVRARRGRDVDLAEGERAVEQIWNTLAATRLTFIVDQERALSDQRRFLEGRAVGEFMDRPYARTIAFVARKVDGPSWRVEQMSLGEQLSEAPDFLDAP